MFSVINDAVFRLLQHTNTLESLLKPADKRLFSRNSSCRGTDLKVTQEKREGDHDT